MDQELYK
jgi:hypothetical protein